MNYSLPKGRNYSKENLQGQKYLTPKTNQRVSFVHFLSSSLVLQQNNKNSIRRQSEDLSVKKTYFNGVNLKNSAYDTKFNNLNKKFKDILNGDDKINRTQSQNKINSSEIQNKLVKKNQSMILKESVIFKDDLTLSQKKDSTLFNTNLYFLECLKRKNHVTTQFYINIHTSILTFKQFYKLAQQSKPRPVDPNLPPENPNRKTIVFDMDETLIHTNEMMTPGYQLKVPFKAFQGKVSNGYVNVRPYAKEILKRLSKYFDIIVFTAGNKCYADPILDHIDPTGVIQYRLYRQSCTFVANQLFVKDLRILGRRLQNVVLVDNAPHSYLMQMSNGIPILNYFKGKQDNQLYFLEHYLMSLLQVNDVRAVNSQYFRLHEYMKFESHDKLIQSLYSKKL